MKSTTKLKAKIKKKFGTYSNFTRAAGMDRYELQRDFLQKKEVPDQKYEDIEFAFNKFDHVHKYPKLDKKTRDWMKWVIDIEGGVIAFCEANDFNKNTVFQYLSGYYEHITPNIQKVIDVLKKKASEEVSNEV